MLPLVAGAAVFVAVALALLGLIGSRGSMSDPERRVLALRAKEKPGDRTLLPMFRRPASSIPLLNRVLIDSPWATRVALELEQGAVRLRVGEYVTLRLVCAAAAFVIVMLVGRMSGIAALIALLAASVAFMAPAFWVASRRRHRVERINRQLPEFLSLLANSLRAGFAFLQSVETACRQVGPPIGDDLQIMLADTALGASTEDALRDLASRTGSYELELVVTAILVQRTTGGNLAELLDNVANTMRERERVHGEIRVLTAQQRLAGNILAVYPAVLALILFAMNPDVMSALWTETVGRVLLAIAGTLQIIGYIAIRRLLEIEF